jgi:hypothetical protein
MLTSTYILHLRQEFMLEYRTTFSAVCFDQHYTVAMMVPTVSRISFPHLSMEVDGYFTSSG